MADQSAPMSNSSQTQLTVGCRTRADRNQALNAQTDTTLNTVLFPTLGDGITLLDIEGDRGVPLLQSLVLDHLLMNDGPAFWVDANGYTTTTTFARLAPSQRLLDRIHVVRGFTTYQHYGALCDLPGAVTQRLQHATTAETEDTPQLPTLIVCSALDSRYRDADTLDDDQARTLQARALARLTTYADGYDAPVLVTRTTRDEFTAPIQTVADHHIECEQTRMGPRFTGEEFETLVYPIDGGAFYQTTFAYWRQILDARAKRIGHPTTPTPQPETPGDIGIGMTTEGSTVAQTANPLLDVWTGATSTGGR